MTEQENVNWADSQPTAAQRQAFEYDDSQTACKVAYVAERELVEVNESNVDDLFQSLSGEDSTLIQLQNVFNTKTKVEFESHVITQEYGDELRLEELRDKIFVKVKDIRAFPFPKKCELKKRIHSRKGDSVSQKLAQDIYSLVNVLDGGPFDALKDMMSIPKGTPLKRGGSVSMSQSEGSMIDTLRSMVTKLQADMLQVKEANSKLSDSLKKDLCSVRSDLTSFRKDTSDLLSELQQTVMEHSHALERIGDERCLGIAQTKSDVKQLRLELKVCNDTVESEIRQCNSNCDKSAKALEKRIGKIEKRLRSTEIVPSDREEFANENMFHNNVDSSKDENKCKENNYVENNMKSHETVDKSAVADCVKISNVSQRIPIASGTPSDGQLYYTVNEHGPRFERHHAEHNPGERHLFVHQHNESHSTEEWQPGERQPGGSHPAECQSTERQHDACQQAERHLDERQSVECKRCERQSVECQHGERQQGERQSAECQLVGYRPTERQYVERQHDKCQQGEAQPTDCHSAESMRGERQSVERQHGERQQGERQSGERQSVGYLPAERQHDERQQGARQSADRKSVGQMQSERLSVERPQGGCQSAVRQHGERQQGERQSAERHSAGRHHIVTSPRETYSEKLKLHKHVKKAFLSKSTTYITKPSCSNAELAESIRYATF